MSRTTRIRVSSLNQDPAAVTWARTMAGLTKRALAHRIGISEQLMGDIEAGWRAATPANLAKIAEALGYPVTALQHKNPIATPRPESLGTPSAVPGQTDLYELGQAIRAIRQVSRGGRHAAPADVVRTAVDDIRARWLPTATAYRDRTSSPAEYDEWTRLIDTCQSSSSPAGGVEAMMIRPRNTLTLLYALAATVPEQPTVTLISSQLRDEIEQGERTAGDWLILPDIADQYHAPIDRARLALADLVTVGAVTDHRNGAYRVAHGPVT